jgi:HlyD family secretion protein
MNAKTWTVLILLILAGLAAWGIGAAVTSGVPVDVAVIERGPIREFVDERAKTRLPETYLVTMPFPGRISGEPLASLEEGIEVRAGQEVARIVPVDLELSLDEATAAVNQLTARIDENADASLEQIVLRQSEEYVKAMAKTVDAALAQVSASAARAAYEEVNLRRIKQLFRTGAKTEDDLDQAELRHKEAAVSNAQDRFVHEATKFLQIATNMTPELVRQYIERKGFTADVLRQQKAAAESRLDQAELQQDRGTMRSPVDGVILARHVTNERFLPAGTTLVEIGRLEDLEVEAEILTLDVVEAERGDRVTIYGPAIGEPAARGTVERIYPAGFTKVSSLGVEQQRVIVIVRFDPEDLERLRREKNLGVGYRVRVEITTAEKPDALVAPRSALFRAADGTWQVFAARGGKARLQPVEVGLMNDQHVEITSGLAEGDRVIVAPESTLTDGTRVEARLAAETSGQTTEGSGQ